VKAIGLDELKGALSPGEVAVRLFGENTNKTRVRLHRLRHSKRFPGPPCVQVGRVHFYPKARFEAWFKDCHRPGAQ